MKAKWPMMLIGMSVCLCGSKCFAGQNSDLYQNARFGFEVHYPAPIFSPQGESDNGDGQRFISRDGKAEFRVWGTGMLPEETLGQAYQKELADSSRTVTYKRLGQDFYVVSGVEGKEIFYEKIMHTEDRFLGLIMRYPSSARNDFDPLVSQIVKSFRPIPNWSRLK
jgi:hypothetical protein